jgi:hypothetical protein
MKRRQTPVIRAQWDPGAFQLSAAEEDLIVDPVVDSDRVRVSGSLEPAPPFEHDLGIPPWQLRIDDAVIVFKRSDGHWRALEILMRELENPATPLNFDWFTAEDFARFFGLSQRDVEKIVAWLESQGLESIEVSPTRTSITFSGNLLSIEAAFHTEFRRYRFNGKEYLTNASELSIPAAFAGVVDCFSKLGGFVPASKPRARHSAHR